jgi:hypothetical protein
MTLILNEVEHTPWHHGLKSFSAAMLRLALLQPVLKWLTAVVVELGRDQVLIVQ